MFIVSVMLPSLIIGHHDLVGNEVGGVETHTELANHGQVSAGLDGL